MADRYGRYIWFPGLVYPGERFPLSVMQKVDNDASL